ncbi:MAG: hypothetical protein V2J12_09485, partial [Gammaproteobacteria bacterium]|nr:hypothetical protein [Gammaproteobacteria bacterium]
MMQLTTAPQFAIASVALALVTGHWVPAARAQQDLAAELQQMTTACRAARSDCYSTCVRPSRQIERGREVPAADIEACRNAHAKLGPPAAAEPAWTPDYAPLPDVVGVFRGGTQVAAQGRDDWKRYCRSSALLGEAETRAPWDIPKGATVRVSGVRYVTNPVRDFDKSTTACRADSVEVVAT